ncbi:ccg-8-like clock controled protein [Grosmannia clavigera kw1407]|uniref:Ccg-8-like clock controled protein n=1 Tax=Grosmannia clavigera (strain kw1407 / UAMH 11150) TaxID=655863 RepID=F0XNV1_GROCL|nr:ccg-8-like clock controled protein [Grosmannia clavigera kw1407]EFX00510.1 ccg-8-like clock controled protein [Grosmannia clavigera kw1407]
MSSNRSSFDSTSRESDALFRPGQQPSNALPRSTSPVEVEHVHFPPISTVVASAAVSSPSPAHDNKAPLHSAPHQQISHWPSVNPLAAYYTPGYVQAVEYPLKTDADASSTSTGTAGGMSPEYHIDGRASSVSLDDPDVRLAAEALGDLRAGTTSAYNSSKNFSPRFKSSVEYVEGYLTPIGNTLGSVSRVTGVENGVRWFLKGGRRHLRSGPSDLETGSNNHHKRRRLDLDSNAKRTIPAPWRGPHTDMLIQFEGKTDVDGFGFTKERRPSLSTVETPPAYDEQTSPAYTEFAECPRPLESDHDGTGQRQRTFPPAAWQSRLIMSTSGLSIAMSEESLRSLKYCLHWLRWANDRIGNTINTLKSTLEQFESEEASRLERVSGDRASNDHTHAPSPVEAGTGQSERSELAARITALRGDVLQTLRGVIDTVSKYAGGALPDNARDLVRRHLTSLPQRFRLANHTDAMASEGEDAASDNELKENAQRVLVLAREGLDMMAQVSGVLDGTIVSAKEWCERLGKKKREERGHLIAKDSISGPMSGKTVGAVDVVMK